MATGGAGFIGAHVVVALMESGFDVVILDSFANAAEDVPDRIAAIVGWAPAVVRADVRDDRAVEAALRRWRCEAVIHLAGVKAVGESVAEPLRYYDVNLGGAVALFEAMRRSEVGRLVFSSSATVYQPTDRPAIGEADPTGPTNPYGRTKLMIEQVVDDAVAAGALSAAISLRYFNPVGAHPSGTRGEAPAGAPNNLFPFIAQTAAGLRDRVRVFGADYATPDGTGVRDYIHVVDLARGHVAAVERLLSGHDVGGHNRINLGTGRGYSVLEAIAAFAQAAGRPIPVEIAPRRPGDAAACVADPRRAEALLGWRARMGLDRMCADHWAFQRRAGPAAP